MKRLPFLLAALILGSCGKQETARRPAPVPPSAVVKVQKAKLEPHVAVEEVVGTVRSKQRAVVEAKISGRVMEYLAIPGAIVKAGELLARIEVPEIQAQVDQAKAVLDQGQRDLDRQKQLIASNTTTRQEYDAANARVNVATAGLSEAETMMSYARVTAPFDGVVTRKLAEVGDLAMPGKPLLEIEAPTGLRFEADLPEAILSGVTMGATMSVWIASVAHPLEATVSEIAPISDPASRTFQIKLDLPAVASLRSGQFGRVSVPIGEAKLIVVPKVGLIKRGQMELMIVVNDGHAALRLVKTGKTLGDVVEVLSGLEEGEQVVVSDPAKLKDGQPVTIQP